MKPSILERVNSDSFSTLFDILIVVSIISLADSSINLSLTSTHLHFQKNLS